MRKRGNNDDAIGWGIFTVVVLIMLGAFLYLAVDGCKPVERFVKPVCVPGDKCCPEEKPVPEQKPSVKPPKPCPGPCPGPCKPSQPPTVQPVKPKPPTSPAKPPEIKVPPIVTCGAAGPSRVLAFTASWCGPCQAIKPKLEQIRQRGVEVVEIDIDKDPKAMKHAKITVVPTIYVCFKGKHKPQKVRDVDEALSMIP